MAIALVSGGVVKAVAINGGDITITLPTLLEGDVVYVATGHPRVEADAGMSTSGYTELIDVAHSAGTPSVKMSVNRKVMGPSPDATAVCLGSGDGADGGVGVAICLRGVDQATPEDATRTTAEGSSTNPDPPAITTVTDGAWVLSFASTRIVDTVITAPAGYGNQIDFSANDTNDQTTAGATKAVSPAGVENPATWTGWASSPWVTVTVAVRPAGAGRITKNTRAWPLGVETGMGWRMPA